MESAATAQAATASGNMETNALAAVGALLFRDTRFTRPQATAWVATGGASLEITSPKSDQGWNATSRRQPTSVSCLSCHSAPQPDAVLFGDSTARSPIPAREDHQQTTARNSPPLVGALNDADAAGLLHFDAEFASATDLVRETFLGRNYGWLPSERAKAVEHFARVVRQERPLASETELPAYATLLRGADENLPADLRLPVEARINLAEASDQEIVEGCAQLVASFVKTLQFSRDREGQHDGSPYDAFLAVNRLPRAPRRDEPPHQYARRLRELLAALRAPRYIDEPSRSADATDEQRFRFGQAEVNGMRIFFREALGEAQRSGAGNCAECHVPPHFTDFRFHNTGATQDEYDALHGDGAFARLRVPDLAERNRTPLSWLPPSATRPDATGVFRSASEAAHPERADLGLWNVFANPDIPAPQERIRQLLNADRRLTQDELLAKTLARFKTSSIRGLAHSAPYMHSGQLATVRDTVLFYQRMSDLARIGKLRNAPPEYFAMRLSEDDIEPLAAFLHALNDAKKKTVPPPVTAEPRPARRASTPATAAKER